MVEIFPLRGMTSVNWKMTGLEKKGIWYVSSESRCELRIAENHIELLYVQCISFWDVKRYDKCQLEDDWLEKERERGRQAAKRSWKRRLCDTWWRAAVIRLNTSENKVTLENLGRESYSDKGISHILREIFLHFNQRISQTLWHLMTRLKWFG